MSRRPIAVQVSIIIFGLVVSVTSAWAAHEKVLHSFDNGSDGAFTYANLIFDGSGNLYGTTYQGGIHGVGTVFELTPNEGGGWTEKVLHSFGNGSDGVSPFHGLTLDAAGNLYGTTYGGGIHFAGTVFELTPIPGGEWTEKVLHSFGADRDGVFPQASLIFDAAGNLYGTTYEGGIHGYGTVFELTPREGGGWTEKVLHSFGAGTDGVYPYSGLTIDAAGNFYGTTIGGGIHGWGTVFELVPRHGGGWDEQVLHSFNNNGTDGFGPEAGLVFDAAGNLYGTTEEGGIHSSGTVFALMPREGGGWIEKVLHSFGGNRDGALPFAGLTMDAFGNLYGTTFLGGTHSSGTVFELMPAEGGGWSEKVLHSFGADGDGDAPFAGLLLDGNGNLYGTTDTGGIHNYGTVFEITP